MTLKMTSTQVIMKCFLTLCIIFFVVVVLVGNSLWKNFCNIKISTWIVENTCSILFPMATLAFFLGSFCCAGFFLEIV